MMLDAVLPISNLDWFTTASEKAAYVASVSTATGADGSRQQRSDTGSANGPRFASTFPIGREPDGRIVLVYLVTEVWPERFRRFLEDHVPLLQLAPTWTLRLVFPRPLDNVYDAYQAVIRDELESPIHPGIVHELPKYFEGRRRAAHAPAYERIGRTSNAGPRFLQTPRADLAPVYAMIFSRLKAAGADWVYHFPELGIVELPSRDDDPAPSATGYSVSQSAVAELNAQRRRAEVQRVRAELEEANARAREETLDREPPATVRAYRQVHGRDPRGWPPA